MRSIHAGRRRFLTDLFSAGLCGLTLSAAGRRAYAQAQLPLTPACADGDEPTPRQTEGPYFTPNSPERTMLREAGMQGMPITLAGLVLTRSCRPVDEALVELWQADAEGRYDNDGFRLRGHQFTRSDGSYAFETIVPGLYPGRTRHFHLKFQPPGGAVLTTQFYFPGEPENQRDRIFNPMLLLKVEGSKARFDTVLNIV